MTVEPDPAGIGVAKTGRIELRRCPQPAMVARIRAGATKATSRDARTEDEAIFRWAMGNS
jgi:hypothetical protein